MIMIHEMCCHYIQPNDFSKNSLNACFLKQNIANFLIQKKRKNSSYEITFDSNLLINYILRNNILEK